jgi:hypothetical protein
VAGIAAAVLLALAGALDYYQSLSATSASGDRFQIAVQEERFRGVAAALPSNAVAGYISDVPLSDAAGQVLFGAARYALAPVLLTVSGSKVRPEWVVGNFAQPVDPAQVAAEHGLRVVTDSGNGVVLFRRDAGR